MSNAAESLGREAAFLEAARVLACERGVYVIASGANERQARRAAACLVEPRVGDRVLVALVGDDTYVVTVLESEAPDATTIDIPGDLQLRVRRRLQVVAQERIDLTSADEATLTAPRLKLTADDAKAYLRELFVSGDRADAHVKKVGVVAETIDTVAERLRQKLQRCYRWVKGIEQLRGGTIDYKATSYARVHAPNTLVTADQLVKLDGDQIHLG